MSVQVATLASRNFRMTEATAATAALLTSVAAGVALAVEPVLALLPIVALASVLLLVNGRARILFVVFGGLFILQREEGLDMSKMAFLAVFAVAFVGAFLNVRTMWDTPAYRLARPLLAASTAFVVLAALSLAVAHNNGIPLVGAWLRDIAPYLLFASAPIFALDAQASLSRRGLVALLVTVGTVGAFAFAVHWLDRRGIANLYASRIGLASHFVPAALFAYGMSAVLQAKRSRWLALSALVLALLLVTGTRTNLVLLVAPLAIALGARRHRATRTVRLALLGPIAMAITLAIGLSVVSVSNANEELLSKRIAIFKSSGSSSDDSYIERQRQARAAWEVFKSNTFVGAGPGTAFEWQKVEGQKTSSFLLDTPLTFPAKFGLVGLVILAIVIGKYWLFARSLVRRHGPTVEQLALVGYLAVVAASSVAISPLEDKGLSFGLIPLLALAFSEVNRGGSASEDMLVRDELRSTPRR